MRWTTRTRWLGFSLVELMAVLAVIGILVALALPRFRVFIARGRQGEAIQNLGVIHKLQNSYNLYYEGFGKDGVYYVNPLIGEAFSGGSVKCAPTDLKNELGFRVEDCTRLRYLYSSGTDADSAMNDASGQHKIYPDFSCTGSADMWAIYRVAGSGKAGELKHVQDVVKHCSG